MTACCFLGITFTTGENNKCEVYVEREGKKTNLDSIPTLFIQIPKTYPFLSIHAVEQIHFNPKSFLFLLKRPQSGFLSLPV